MGISKKWLFLSVALVGGALAQSGGNYEVTNATPGAGGGDLQGGTWSASVSTGQISASSQSMTGGAWSVAGGMWPAVTGDDTPELLFADSFEQ